MLDVMNLIIFYTLSMPFSNSNSDVVKWRGSGKYHIELPVGERNRRWWIYTNMFMRLPLSLNDCHSKRDFDRKSFAAQFEGNGAVWWTQLSSGYKDSSCRANNFRCYAVPTSPACMSNSSSHEKNRIFCCVLFEMKSVSRFILLM
jgi:hypothetical protein